MRVAKAVPLATLALPVAQIAGKAVRPAAAPRKRGHRRARPTARDAVSGRTA